VKTSREFKIYEKRRASGAIQYRVDLGMVNGKRVQKNFSTKEEAEAYRNQCIAQGANTKTEVLQELDAAMRHDILACLERLRVAGSTIKEATDFFLKHSKPSKGNIHLSELVTHWEKIKRGAGMSERYLSSAQRCYFTPFVKHVKNCGVMDVTKEQAERYLYGNAGWNPVTVKTTHTHLTTLFNFAIKEGYATLNPFAKVQRTKRTASTAKFRVLPVAAAQGLLQFALDKGNYAECASLVLTFFCGVRAEEVMRVKWEDIKLKDKSPIVVVDYPKIAHQRRINALPANAVSWLKRCNDKGKAKGIVAPADYPQRMARLRRRFYKHLAALNVELKKDGEPLIDIEDMQYHQNSARICFASYHIAYHEDAAKTSMLLGHQTSSTLLYTTYRALVTKEQSKLYWTIRPDRDVTINKPETPQELRDEEEALQAHLDIMRGEEPAAV
jgi:integrase